MDLTALKDDEVRLVYAFLANALVPQHAAALSGVCKRFVVPLDIANKLLRHHIQIYKFLLIRKLPRSMELYARDHINLFGARLTAAHMNTVALIVDAMPFVKSITLDSNKIGDEGIAALASSLRTRRELVSLSLVNCNIGAAGVAHLVRQLCTNEFKNLSQLLLNDDTLKDAACKELVAAIESGRLPNLLYWRGRRCGSLSPASQAVDNAIVKAQQNRFSVVASAGLAK